jgi:acyl-CoA hydrolase
MEVGIKVISEDIRSQVVRHVVSCFFTVVAMDDFSKPKPVPPFEPKTPDEIRRYAMAQVRKQSRLACSQ